MKILREGTVWDNIGWDDGPFRIKNGRVLYEAIMYNCHNGGDKVKIARLEVSPNMKIREVSRYVSPDTIVEFLDKN